MASSDIVKGVCLDLETYRPADLDLTSLKNALPSWDFHDHSKPEDIVFRLQGAQVAVANKALLMRDVIESCSDLKLIAVAATGINNVDLEAAKEKGITVCNVTGYATPAVVQHAFSLMLALITNLTKYHEVVQAGEWQKSKMFSMIDFPIGELSGRILGIIGYGELGKGVHHIAEAFGMKVMIAERPGVISPRTGRHSFEDVLKQADIISIHCPLTPETRNMIAEKELGMMKKTALIINTARGGIVNEQDLAAALKRGDIAGAGLDVLSQEPPRNGNPLLEPDVPNVIITPHMAWASREARQRLIEEIALNINAFKTGKPRNVVSGERVKARASRITIV